MNIEYIHEPSKTTLAYEFMVQLAIYKLNDPRWFINWSVGNETIVCFLQFWFLVLVYDVYEKASQIRNQLI